MPLRIMLSRSGWDKIGGRCEYREFDIYTCYTCVHVMYALVFAVGEVCDVSM